MNTTYIKADIKGLTKQVNAIKHVPEEKQQATNFKKSRDRKRFRKIKHIFFLAHIHVKTVNNKKQQKVTKNNQIEFSILLKIFVAWRTPFLFSPFLVS
jgi:hypothetical protein